MKFKRKQTPTHWLVEDLYLRESWGKPYSPVAPARGSNLRRFFVLAMVIFGIVDVIVASIYMMGVLFPTRATNPTAARNAATNVPTKLARPPTAVAQRANPTRTPTRRLPTSTRAPTIIPTRRPALPTQAPAAPPTQVALAVPQNNAKNAAPSRTISVDMPASLNTGALSIGIPPEPNDCTPANAMPDVIDVSVKLCSGQTYRPFLLRGNNIGVFGDRSAIIRSSGRGYGIIAEGSNLFIRGVTIRGSVEGGDDGILLCLYPDCRGRAGGVAYGGGILVRAINTTVMDSDIGGGVAGVAADHVTGLKLINNRLDGSSGWGSYNFAVDNSFFVGNSFNQDNRSCTSPDGVYLSSGCESAGLVFIASQRNIIARNTCTNSGDCYYINGEGNLTSNFNRFHKNECRASPHNCFEVTFSVGNEFVENITGNDPATGAACKYPFWVGGSKVLFARNTWSCTISPDTALRHAAQSTSVPTSIENIQ